VHMYAGNMSVFKVCETGRLNLVLEGLGW